MTLEVRTAPIKTDGEKIHGTAVNYGVLSHDLGGFIEEFRAGAFDLNGDVIATVEHDNRMLLGRRSAGTLKLLDDTTGLHVVIDPPDTSYARDLKASMRRGDRQEMSFSFRVKPGGEKWEKRDNKVVRTISSASISEVTITSTPAYPNTEAALRSLAEFRAEFDESKVHRDDAGRFGDGGDVFSEGKKPSDKAALRVRATLEQVIDKGEKLDEKGAAKLKKDLAGMTVKDLRELRDQRRIADFAGGLKKADLVGEMHADILVQAEKTASAKEKQMTKAAEKVSAADIAPKLVDKPVIDKAVEDVAKADTSSMGASLGDAAKVFEGGTRQLIKDYGVVGGSAIAGAAFVGGTAAMGATVATLGLPAIAIGASGALGKEFDPAPVLNLAAQAGAAILAAPVIALAQAIKSAAGLFRRSEGLSVEETAKLGAAWMKKMYVECVAEFKKNGRLMPSADELQESAEIAADIYTFATQDPQLATKRRRLDLEERRFFV